MTTNLKFNVHKIASFIKDFHSFEQNIVMLIEHYLDLIESNVKLKKTNEQLLTEITERDKMIEEMEREIDELKTVH